MRPDNGVDIAMRPSLSFSKFCPSAKRKHRSNHRASASNQSSLSIFNSSETHESAKAEADFKSMPIPSFKSSLDREKDDQLEQMERSLFAELQPTKKSKVSAVKSVAAVKRPPIPTFSLSNDSGSDDDDDDLLLAPVFPSNKCSMDQGKPRPMTTIESVDKVAKNDNSYESKVQAKSCEEETGKNCKNGRTSSGDNPPEQRLNHSGDNSDSGISVIREDEKCSTKRKAETIVPVSDSTASTKTKQPRHQPSLDETFINAIDDIFQGSDQATLTVKQFTLALEKHFQVKFTPKTKSFVKKRLSDLVNGVIVPSASAEKHTFHKADLPLVDISNDDMNPKGPQPIDTQKTPKAIDNNPKTKPVFSKDVSNQKHGGNSSTNELKNQERPERKDFPLEKPKDVPVAVQMNESNLNKTPIPPPQHYPLTKPENIKTGRVEVHNVDSDEFQVVPAPSIGASENADAVASNNPSTVVGNKKRQVKRKRPSARSKKAEIKCDEYPTSAKCDAGPVDSNESTVTKPLPKKATRKRARAGTCSLCKTCPCTATSAAEKRLSSGSLELPTLNRSDAAIENTLVRRLQKLEKTTEKFEEQTEIVRRELKKHRRNVWRREEANKPDCKILAKDRFLPDGVELDSQLGILNNPTKISESIMKRVQVAAFGRECIPSKYSCVFDAYSVESIGSCA